MTISLRRCHTLKVGDGDFSHKIDYVTVVKEILNVEGHPNHITSNGDLTEWLDVASWWSCIGKGLHAACGAGLFLNM